MPERSDRPPWATTLRQRARDIFQAGVGAADPESAVARTLVDRSGRLEVRRGSGDVRAKAWTGVRVLAFGKAACAMARAAGQVIPKGLFHAPGIAVTNYENMAELSGFQVTGAGHPLPDENGVKGAAAIAAAAGEAGTGELVLVLISGGGSALLPYPAEGLTLADKVATTDLLLASGADIGEMNTVRKHLSRLKGGGLARLAAPADLHALILSDVLGDDLSTIASGPTAPDPTTFADAQAVLTRTGVWDRASAPVRDHVTRGVRGEVPETPKPGDPVFASAEATLVGSNAVSLEAMRAAAEAAGHAVLVHSERLEGEARDAGGGFAAAAAEAIEPQDRRPLVLVAGGETTVTIKGGGRGGRNQEMALAFALAAEKCGLSGHWAFLSGGTDGRDGPTDAAGGLVDPDTCARIRAAGGDIDALLGDNNSYEALRLAGDLLMTGATGTNVADLQVLVIGE
jgi:hydroxypyruvate reductase